MVKGGGGSVVGVDFSDEVLKQSQSLAKEKGLEGVVSFQAGDVFNLPFENGTFDIGEPKQQTRHDGRVKANLFGSPFQFMPIK